MEWTWNVLPLLILKGTSDDGKGGDNSEPTTNFVMGEVLYPFGCTHHVGLKKAKHSYYERWNHDIHHLNLLFIKLGDRELYPHKSYTC